MGARSAELRRRTEQWMAEGRIPQSTRRTKTVRVQVQRLPCKKLGTLRKETVDCPSCGGKRVSLKVYDCQAYAEGCTIGRRVDGKACCDALCRKYESP